MLITLSDAKPADERYRYRREMIDALALRVMAPENTRRHSRYDETISVGNEQLVRHSLPAEPDATHLNYLEALGVAWGRHRGISFTPDILWFGLLNEIAKGVTKAPDKHRALFTRSPDPVTIALPVSSADEPLPMEDLLDRLLALVPVPVDLFVPRFSTTTDMARMTHLASFAEAASPYYSYMTFMCDIPFVRVEGHADDWDRAHQHAIRLHDEFARVDSPLAPWIATTMVGLTGQVIEAVRDPQGKGASFFGSMFNSERCGSGGETSVDGWWSRIYREQPDGLRKPCNFPTQVARVPWKNMETGRQFYLNCGVMASMIDPEDGALVPEFHFIQTELTDRG